MIVGVDVGEVGSAAAAGRDEGEEGVVGMAVGDDAEAVFAGEETHGGGGKGDETVARRAGGTGDGEGVDFAEIIGALVPCAEVEQEAAAGEESANLGVCIGDAREGLGEADAEMWGAEEDGFADAWGGGR